MGGGRIRQLLVEVDAELHKSDGEQSVIIVVGGSLLAWHGLRDATRDVDSVLRLDDHLRRAVQIVAERHGLASDWLNDHAAAFAPSWFDPETCEVLLTTPRLRVLGAPLRDVFLMKLCRGAPQDLRDLRALWPSVARLFESAAEVTQQFYEAFPAEPFDEFLGRLVVTELAKDGINLPET